MAKKKIVSTNNEEEQYQRLRDDVFSTVRSVNTSALLSSWDIGSQFNQFVGDNRNYGKSVVERLAQEMCAEGLAGSVESAKTSIYVSAQINRTFDRQRLEILAEHNMTPSHAKILVSLPTDLIDDVIENAVVERNNGRRVFVSTALLRDLVYERAAALDIDIGRARSSVEHFTQQDVGGPALVETHEDYTVPATAPELPSSQVQQPPTPPASVADGSVGTDSEFAGTEEGQGTHKEPSPPDEKSERQTIASPLKVLKDFEKQATRLQVLCSQVEQAIDQADKQGFDGERAMDNFKNAFDAVKVSARDVVGPVSKLLEFTRHYSFEQPGTDE